MQALVSRKKIVFTRRYVFNTIIALIRLCNPSMSSINTLSYLLQFMDTTVET